MRISALALLVVLWCCGGCSRAYVIKMTNGTKVTTASRPKLDGAYCSYKNAKGETEYIPQGRVLEILPASLAAEEEKKNKFNTPPQKR